MAWNGRVMARHDLKVIKENLFTRKWVARCTCGQSFRGDTHDEAMNKFSDHTEAEYWKEPE